MAEIALKLEPVTWNDEAQTLLEPTMGKEPTYTVDDLRTEVMRGTSTLLAGSVNGERVGYVVVFVDPIGVKPEFVIQTGAALRSDTQALRLFEPLLVSMARSKGCGAMRTHLTRKGYRGVYQKMGFYQSEIVMRKGL